jgi:hypothetical protein
VILGDIRRRSQTLDAHDMLRDLVQRVSLAIVNKNNSSGNIQLDEKDSMMIRYLYEEDSDSMLIDDEQ